MLCVKKSTAFCEKDDLLKLLNAPLSVPKGETDMVSLSVLKSFLYKMILIRSFEELLAQTYLSGQVGGFCHLCIGQEAIPVAASFAMRPEDTMITAYRAHGHALARGLEAKQVACELMGKRGGSSKGKGGSMHIFYPENQFFGGHGIVGAQVSLGTGIGFSHKYLRDDGVCLTFLGDGATNQGQFFESMNMAALWHLPVLYIIENNGYAMGTSVKDACAGPALYKRGEPFGIAGHMIEGDRIEVVYASVKDLLEHVRTTSFPLLLEIETVRFKGHSMSDPGKYRTRQALEQARKSRDPIINLRTHLMQTHQVSPEDLKTIENTARQYVDEAFSFAQKDLEPDMCALHEDIVL